MYENVSLSFMVEGKSCLKLKLPFEVEEEKEQS